MWDVILPACVNAARLSVPSGCRSARAKGEYGCAQYPVAVTKEIYCLRILPRQDDLNMWVMS